MKKLFLAAVIAVFSLGAVNAQDTSFGVTAGYINGSFKAKVGSVSASTSESGFYGGVFAEFPLTEEIRLQPAVTYVAIEDANAIFIPVMAKYYVSEQFNIQAGPQFDISLEDVGDDYSALGIDLGFGVGYDITENFLAEARYAFQLNNRYTGSDDFSAKVNYITVGLGYRF